MNKFDEEFKHFYDRKNSLMLNIQKLEQLHKEHQDAGGKNLNRQRLMTQLSSSLLKSTDKILKVKDNYVR